MKRKVGLMLLVMGLTFAGWNGYAWLSETSSGRESIDENDIAKADEIEKVESGSIDAAEQINEDLAMNKKKDTFKEKAIRTSKKVEKPAELKQRDYQEYERGENIGWLLIPSLDKKYPIYWGTDEETLTQGVGYHVGKFTTPPDGQGHTVLSGHRDTVFRELGNLKEGDKMYMQFEDVQYAYQINRTWVTSAEDRTVIVAKEEPVLTLTTCYPFTFLGAAPDRYILEAPLVEITKMES